ncbi:hypothetical protein MKK64_17465 [Methylobacterium sp. E-025]|uniref:hypothetical protein n=1 Tax=Methylobacterium sp. E-025 TaxID=2836561 RepID=UPI001FBA527C|nr:hypothetical protein [Methylobacterium sp. E-025]MCJ2112972.1 hypothetical protein [Methylobacterium sp. E-025]
MSEDEIPDFNEALEQEYREFLKDKGVRINCELCDSTDFNVITDYRNAHAAVPYFQNAEGLVNKIRIPCMVMSCVNCGNIRLLSQSAFTRWKETRPAEDPSDVRS